MVDVWLLNKNIHYNNIMAAVLFLRWKDHSHLAVDWETQKLVNIIDKLPVLTITTTTSTETQGLSEVPYTLPPS